MVAPRAACLHGWEIIYNHSALKTLNHHAPDPVLLCPRHSKFHLALWLLLAPLIATAQIAPGRDQNFDAGWFFSLSDPKGADQPDFQDSAWRKLDLPHDWSIEGPIDQNNPAGFRGAFVPTGVGWYRKHFTLSSDAAGKRVFIEFDGIMANSDVYINGFDLGHRPNGWVPFQYDISSHVTFGPGPTQRHRRPRR